MSMLFLFYCNWINPLCECIGPNLSNILSHHITLDSYSCSKPPRFRAIQIYIRFLRICKNIKSAARQLNNWIRQSSSMTVMGEEKYLGKQSQSVSPETQTQLGFLLYSNKLNPVNRLLFNIVFRLIKKYIYIWNICNTL